jgi:hypothetical protein
MLVRNRWILRLVVVAMAAVFIALPALAAQCVDNFTQSGNTFSTFIELKGADPDRAYVAIAQNMAGLLGFNANKELRIISAYQETESGKKSTHTTVFSEPKPGTLRVEATFVLAKGATAPKGAIRDILCARLALAIPPDQRANAGPAETTIRLRTTSGDVGIDFAVGEHREVSGLVFLVFSDFAEAHAKIRVHGKRPVLLVRSDEDPAKTYVLVKCDSDSAGNKRSVKLGSARKLLKMAFTGGGALTPDKDWTIPTTPRQQGAGSWIVTPSLDLQPGEYGLWDLESGGVALFGVDLD